MLVLLPKEDRSRLANGLQLQRLSESRSSQSNLRWGNADEELKGDLRKK